MKVIDKCVSHGAVAVCDLQNGTPFMFEDKRSCKKCDNSPGYFMHRNNCKHTPVTMICLKCADIFDEVEYTPVLELNAVLEIREDKR